VSACIKRRALKPLTLVFSLVPSQFLRAIQDVPVWDKASWAGAIPRAFQDRQGAPLGLPGTAIQSFRGFVQGEQEALTDRLAAWKGAQAPPDLDEVWQFLEGHLSRMGAALAQLPAESHLPLSPSGESVRWGQGGREGIWRRVLFSQAHRRWSCRPSIWSGRRVRRR
jgi:hypothetical protein